MRSIGKNRTDRSGRKQGYWEYYYDNGVLYSKGSYKDGYKVGMWDFYKEDGSLDYMKLWDNGYYVGFVI